MVKCCVNPRLIPHYTPSRHLPNSLDFGYKDDLILIPDIYKFCKRIMSRPRIHQDALQLQIKKANKKNLKINHKATMQQSKNIV